MTGRQAYAEPSRVRQELEALCRTLRAGNNVFFGTGMVGHLERELDQTPADALALATRHGVLGFHKTRLGRHQESIAHLATMLELLAAIEGAPDELRREALELLAINHFLLGEGRNCVALGVQESCILPIAPAAIHRVPEHGRSAGDAFARLLELDPDHAGYRWLLNLSRMLTGDYPEGVPEHHRLPQSALRSELDFPVWRDVASLVGVDAFDLSGGAIIDDFDGDGLLDIVSSSWDPCEPIKAFRNDGAGGFADVSAEWGLDTQLGGLNLVHADFDGDGMLDLLVLRGAWMGDAGRIRNSLIRNDLKRSAGIFVDVTVAAGMAHPAYPTQAAAWADFDGDGDLDVYIGNESTEAVTDPTTFRLGSEAHPSQLFRNNGDGTFTDVARRAGVTNDGFAKGVAWGDYDDDGDPDLFVSNIGPNRLFRNEGDGSFSDLTVEAGLDASDRTFATWFFDFDNDGDLDLLVNDYGSPVEQVAAAYFGSVAERGHPVLYRNQGGRFRDVSKEVGLDRPLLVMGANFGDLDNDGWLDLYLGTGVPLFDGVFPNVVYRNRGGQRFDDVTLASGLGHLQKGHGVAFGDVDNDGRQDLYQQLGGAYPYDRYHNALYLNPERDHRWLVLRLRGTKANRFGVGARIRVDTLEGDAQRSIHLVAGSGGSFGGSSLQQEIGLGRAASIERLVIRWPGSGTEQTFTSVELDRHYEAVEGQAALVPLEVEKIQLSYDRARHPRHP